MNDKKEELVIDESNFSQYFRDCRTSKPERGDIMARYSARAEFIDGQMKRDIIDLLHNRDKTFAATQVMRKLGCATQKDSIRVCKEICQDLFSGMSLKEVEQKVYTYDIELFYYTKKEYIPIDDMHWTPIGIANLDDFLDQSGTRLTLKSKIIDKMSEVSETNKEIHDNEQIR
jgi:hypothetical protein